MNGSAAQMWKSLTDNYSAKLIIGAINTRAKLKGTKMAEGTDIKTHLGNMHSLWRAANDEGADIKESMYRTILVSSLPILYFNIIGNIIAAVNLNNAEQIIINWKSTYDQLGGASQVTPIPSNMTTTTLAANTNLNQSQISCRNCKRRGHTDDDCYRPGGGKEGQFPPNFERRGGGNRNNPGGNSSRSNTNVSAANAAKVFALATYSNPSGNEFERRTLLDSAATDYCFRDRADFE